MGTSWLQIFINSARMALEVDIIYVPIVISEVVNNFSQNTKFCSLIVGRLLIVLGAEHFRVVVVLIVVVKLILQGDQMVNQW